MSTEDRTESEVHTDSPNVGGGAPSPPVPCPPGPGAASANPFLEELGRLNGYALSGRVEQDRTDAWRRKRGQAKHLDLVDRKMHGPSDDPIRCTLNPADVIQATRGSPIDRMQRPSLLGRIFGLRGRVVRC